jgi:putative transposase
MTQHVTQRGVDRSVIFGITADYQFFRDCLRAACDKHGCRVHAYVFMTNHVHLLVTPTTASGVSRVMQTVGRRYVRRFNDVYNRTGALWEGRYKATIVDTLDYLIACHQYIELNPVRAGLCADPRDYGWSSFRTNALGETDRLVTPHERYAALGPDARMRQSAYRALFGDGLSDRRLAEIRDATNRGWALGSKRFRDEVAKLLARRVEPARPSRRVQKNDTDRRQKDTNRL